MNDYAQLLKSSPVVMVEFYATWCEHCQRMMPVVAQIRELLGDSVKIYQFDIDRHAELASEENVEAAPTFIVYKDAKPMWRYTGEIDGNVLLQKIESFRN
ncbi:MAG: thioredoxin family protein [Muribaculaceae bacterium]|nr:thioredoxin family protein [Muribaculaceae bacterium]